MSSRRLSGPCSALVVLCCALLSSVAANHYNNLFLNGQYQSSGATFTSHAARNPFLDHAIISRQAAPFTGPTYLPPKEPLNCASNQQCVRKENCQGGYYYAAGSALPKSKSCSPDTDVCCSYRAPATTAAPTTQKPYVPCARDSDCVQPSDCRNGEISALNYMKINSKDRCYAPEVCCRLPSTTLTQDGYLVKVPNKVFPLPTNPTVTAAPQTYRPQPTQPITYRPQQPEATQPTNEYLPPQPTQGREAQPSENRPTAVQPQYNPQPTQSRPQQPQYTQQPQQPKPQYTPQPTQARPQQPQYSPQPTQAKPQQPQYTQQPQQPKPQYTPQPTQARPQQPQYTQQPQQPKPQYTAQPTQARPQQPQYTQQPQQPKPQYTPQPTQARPQQPQYTQQPQQPKPQYTPQPTQDRPQQYSPQQSQQRPQYTPQRPQTPNNGYLPPQSAAPQKPQPTQAVYQSASQPQPTQPIYSPQPAPTTTQQTYRPQPQPQTTQVAYRPQPQATTQQTYRPQPQQPQQPQRPQRPATNQYSPAPSQPRQPQPQPQPQTPQRQPAQSAYRPQPQQPARGKPNQGYLPPITDNRIPDEIDRIPESSNVKPLRGEDQLSPAIYPNRPQVAPLPKHFSKCASALLCTDVNYCNTIGVITDQPVNLTPMEAAFRVPLTDCIIPETGGEGKCCRDSNYVDPWPVNLAGVCASRNKNTKPAGIKDIDANFAEIPWQAMILKDSTKSLLCGGAIIGDEFVLTTASCVSGENPSDVRIKAGEWQLGSTSEPLPFQLVTAKTIDLHPEFNPSTGSNDMAIIRLQKRLEFASHIQPICISDEDPTPTEQCVTTGWGKQALSIHEEGAIMHVTKTSTAARGDCGADNTGVCSATKFDACEFDVGSALACGSGSSIRLKGVYTLENGCGEGQTVRFSKPDVKWINTAFADRNRPLLKRRV